MLSKYFQLRYDLPDCVLFDFDNLHRLNPAIPTVLLTHDNYIRDFVRSGARKTAFYEKPTPCWSATRPISPLRCTSIGSIACGRIRKP
jgi:hypothetical protein